MTTLRLAMMLLAATGTLIPACQARPPSQPGNEPPGAARNSSGLLPATFQSHPVAFPQYPCIAPDGSVIVFSYAGDLWSVAATGGVAERLTAHPSDEGRSAFSPDGAYLAFESERDGPANIYIMPVARPGPGASGALVGGSPRRVTIYDKAQALSGFTADGRHVLFSASLEPSIYRMTRMYRAAVDGPEGGGSVIESLTRAYGAMPRATPDGRAILFNRERYDAIRPKYVGPATSDIYRLDLGSGAFTRLTHAEAQDGDGFALPDGSVVFASARDGQNNLYRLKPGADDRAEAERLTNFAVSGPGTGPNQTTIMHGIRDLNVTGWNAVFCVWDTLYTLDLKTPGAGPQPLAIAANGDFSQLDFQRINAGRQLADAALSPDGKTLAVIARGEVFLRSTEKDRPTRHVTATGGPSPWGRCRDLAWSPDGRVLYFSSDASGVSGIYAATVALSREDLASGNASAESGGAEPGAEEKKEEKRPAPKKPDWGKRWAEAVTFKVIPLMVNSGEHSRPIPSPDGKRLLATRGLGDLVLFELDKDDPAKIVDPSGRVVVPSWNEPNAQWASDSRHLIYSVQDVWYNSDIWLLDALADAGTEAAKPVNITRHPDLDHSPRLSADGKVLYFLSDRDAPANGQHDVYAVNLDRRLDGLRPYELAEYFKEAVDKARKRTPLGAAPAAAGAARAGARRPADDKPAEPAAVEKKEEADQAEKKPDEPKAEARTDPKPDAGPSPEKPLKFDADDAFLRVRRVVSMSGNMGNLAVTPGGDRVLFTAQVDGSSQFLSVDHQGRERKTILAGSVSNVSLSLTGDRVLFTSGGAAPRGEGADAPPRTPGGDAYLGRPGGGENERLPVDAPLVIDIRAQQKQKFNDAARLMGQRFYHPTLKGLDWPALMARYESLIVRTRTDTEFNRIFNNLLGELDGSHMGMSGGRSTSGSGASLGYLGIDAKPVPGGYEVARIVPQGPADRPSTRLAVGDVIVAIDNRPLAGGAEATPNADLMAALQGTSGQETLLEIKPASGGANKFILITPISSGADTQLRYRAEVEQRRKEVDRLSEGKLGYLHIRAMDMGSVRDYERDLFAAAEGKLGLIIDVRDNGGGSTADILLSSLTAPRHAYTAARGVNLDTLPRDAYPRDRRLIYAYNREISVLCNQHSYSNAEIFSHSIKTTGRGKVVGVQTFGAVISTGSYGLIDGSNMRTPFRGWYLPDGTDMENNGCMPDIVVYQTPEDETAGRDPQLEAAVKELLMRARTP